MINSYYGIDDVCVCDLNTKEDVVEAIDALHTLAMADCGAIEDSNANSEALEMMNKILDYAHTLEEE